MSALPYAPLDEALERLAPFGIALGNGNFNHAPMVAEALCALGRPDAVLPWIERYRPRLLPRPAAGEPIDARHWRDALGQRERFADWSVFFADRLRESDWRDLLDTWSGRLAPGLSGAAAHGVIRVGHAARGLAVEETPQRRRELGDALASWAASYAELPAANGGRERKVAPEEAILRVAVVPPSARRPGNIAAALARLAEFPPFAPSVALADLNGDIAPRLAELCELFARVYLANVHNIPTAIAFIHGVTSLAAAGHIAAQVDEATARALLRYGWQAGCGLYACFGGDTAVTRDIAGDIAADRDALVDRAVAHGDEHVIKFTEACLSRHALAPSPAYPAAIAGLLAVVGSR